MICLSEHAEKAPRTIQEKIKDARDNESGAIWVVLTGLLLLLIAVIANTADLLIIGILSLVIAMFGIAGFYYYRNRYDTLMEQMQHTENKILTCPKCGKQLPDKNYQFCPFCGSPLTLTSTSSSN